MMIEEKTRSLVTVLIFFCIHSLQLREPNACKALTIQDDNSALFYSLGTLCYPGTEKLTQAPLGPQRG